ncbi:hypothetical protein JAAARDRAFT_48664 [Jaapia argillacea MUCL 33604]|uniref:Uncharacterized protein n=1 Tax=Jaapia argillacea MUCL 33604 TaxID=933084 RepID=A0A067PZQ0_9AGAM|nr:hypothetical protein JAAARDRAFT_48664 [Jaapia argillacea MUCL 33604]
MSAVPPPSAEGPPQTHQNSPRPQHPQQQPFYYYSPPAQVTAGSSNNPSGPSYYNYSTPSWQNSWSYSYSSAAPYHQQYPSYTSQYQGQHRHTTYPQQPASQPHPQPETPRQKRKSPTPSPSPPPPAFHKDWDAIFKSFLERLGFTQALRGFEADILVLNPELERQEVPRALVGLVADLARLEHLKDEDKFEPTPLHERKLSYVHLTNDTERSSQTSVNKSVSQILARNRARNDASNRTEFTQSLAEKRRRLNEGVHTTEIEGAPSIPSCARTDAKPLDRDIQMKYDIAKNEEGPLRRTIKLEPPNTTFSASTSDAKGKGKLQQKLPHDDPAVIGNKPVEHLRASRDDDFTSDHHPGLEERLKNVESHLAVRYGNFQVPSQPSSFLDRLKFLEDHIVLLEKEYPPWAALHFNQPNRGWPPPPRPTPIIVPTRLISASATHTAPSSATQRGSASESTSLPPASSSFLMPDSAEGSSIIGRKVGRTKKDTSLHRAVMEKLEVQQAIHDLAGG